MQGGRHRRVLEASALKPRAARCPQASQVKPIRPGDVVAGPLTDCPTAQPVTPLPQLHGVEVSMSNRPHSGEKHYITRIGWLRAAVLGANDGVLSTASVIVGVAASGAGVHPVLIAGVAALTAGAMSMAAGEYVSVSSQSDTERADLARERRELCDNPEGEQRELAAIYVQRGLTRDLAGQVAQQLMAADALNAHARDELNITAASSPKPVQAALASAASFAAGGLLPALSVAFAPPHRLVPLVVGIALLVLAALGGLGARAGGAPILRAAVRVVFWGALAMGVTFGVGRLFGTTVG